MSGPTTQTDSGTEGARTKRNNAKGNCSTPKEKKSEPTSACRRRAAGVGWGKQKNASHAGGVPPQGTRVPDEGGGGGLSSAQGKAAGGFAGRQKRGAGSA